MALPEQPPRYSSWSAILAPIKEGERGWRVWAVQRVISYDKVNIVQDGVFGPTTKRLLKDWQEKRDVQLVDGVAGPETQAKMLRSSENAVHLLLPWLPRGILEGFADVEGAGVLAATNWYTPPGGREGVDCGAVQWRIYGPPFDQNALKKAFDPRASFTYAGNILLRRRDDFRARNSYLSNTRILQAAVLAHNWPAGADQIVRNGAVSYPNSPATWTQKPGGGHYTRGEWSYVYPQKILAHVD